MNRNGTVLAGSDHNYVPMRTLLLALAFLPFTLSPNPP